MQTPFYPTLGEVRRELAVALGFGAMTANMSLQEPILTAFISQAQNQVFNSVLWRDRLREHFEVLRSRQRVLDIPSDMVAGKVQRVFIARNGYLIQGAQMKRVISEIHFNTNEIARMYEKAIYIPDNTVFKEIKQGIPRDYLFKTGEPCFYEINQHYDRRSAQILFAPIAVANDRKPDKIEIGDGSLVLPSGAPFPPIPSGDMDIIKERDKFVSYPYLVRIEYIAAPDPFINDNSRLSVPSDLVLALAISTAKAHYRQPDAQIYIDRFNYLMGKVKAEQFGSDGEQSASNRVNQGWLRDVFGV